MEFCLRDKYSNKDIMDIDTSKVGDDEDDFMNDVILGLQAMREQYTKVLSEVEKSLLAVIFIRSIQKETRRG